MPHPSRYNSEAYLQAKASGICVICFHAIPIRHICGACLEAISERQQRRRDRWREAGLCSRCGHERDDQSKVTCGVCRKKWSDRWAKTHKKGVDTAA